MELNFGRVVDLPEQEQQCIEIQAKIKCGCKSRGAIIEPFLLETHSNL